MKGCPVMLLVNISDDLVNGLRGEVSSASDDSVKVYFPTLDRHVTLIRHSFTVYSKQQNKDVASRKQIPLRLCFALTVHKSQSLTMDRVHVDCRNMCQQGQIAVALSRCTSKRGLRIENFSLSLLRKPNFDTTEFHERIQQFRKSDLSCCRFPTIVSASTGSGNPQSTMDQQLMFIF